LTTATNSAIKKQLRPNEEEPAMTTISPFVQQHVRSVAVLWGGPSLMSFYSDGVQKRYAKAAKDLADRLDTDYTSKPVNDMERHALDYANSIDWRNWVGLFVFIASLAWCRINTDHPDNCQYDEQLMAAA
jgi:hypothetical protein